MEKLQWLTGFLEKHGLATVLVLLLLWFLGGLVKEERADNKAERTANEAEEEAHNKELVDLTKQSIEAYDKVGDALVEIKTSVNAQTDVVRANTTQGDKVEDAVKELTDTIREAEK